MKGVGSRPSYVVKDSLKYCDARRCYCQNFFVKEGLPHPDNLYAAKFTIGEAIEGARIVFTLSLSNSSVRFRFQIDNHGNHSNEFEKYFLRILLRVRFCKKFNFVWKNLPRFSFYTPTYLKMFTCECSFSWNGVGPVAVYFIPANATSLLFHNIIFKNTKLSFYGRGRSKIFFVV